MYGKLYPIQDNPNVKDAEASSDIPEIHANLHARLGLLACLAKSIRLHPSDSICLNAHFLTVQLLGSVDMRTTVNRGDT